MKKLALLIALLLLPAAYAQGLSSFGTEETFHVRVKGSVINMEWSPDGSMIAISHVWKNSDVKGELLVLRNDGAKIWSKEGIWKSLSWYSGGLAAVKLDYGSSTGEVYLFSDDGNVLMSYGPVPVNWPVIRWAPNGEMFYYMDKGNECRLLTFSKSGMLWDSGPGEDVRAEWSPDNLLAVSVTRQGSHKAYILDGSSVIKEMDEKYVEGWSPDGKMLLIIDFKSPKNYIGDARGDVVVELNDMLTSPSWSPKGDRVVLVKREGAGKSSLYLYDVEGNVLMRRSVEAFRGPKVEWINDEDFAVMYCQKVGGKFSVVVEYYSQGRRAWSHFVVKDAASPMILGKMLHKRGTNSFLVRQVVGQDWRLMLFSSDGRVLWEDWDLYGEAGLMDMGFMMYSQKRAGGRVVAQVRAIIWNGRDVKVKDVAVGGMAEWSPNSKSLVMVSFSGNRQDDPVLGQIYKASEVNGYTFKLPQVTTTTLPGAVKKPESNSIQEYIYRKIMDLLNEPLLLILLAILVVALVKLARR